MWEKRLANLSTLFSTMKSTNAPGNIGEQAVSTLFSGRMTCGSSTGSLLCSCIVDFVLRGRLLLVLGFVGGCRRLG